MLCTATPDIQVQVKISTVRPVFPDCFSISYDYDGKIYSIKIFFPGKVETLNCLHILTLMWRLILPQ